MDLLKNEYSFEIGNLKASKTEIKGRITIMQSLMKVIGNSEKKVLENTAQDQ